MKTDYHNDKSKPDGLCPRCKECKKKLRRIDYIKHKDRYTETNNAWRKLNPQKAKDYVAKGVNKHYRKRRDFLNQLKNKPCIDCGETYDPECMDFDHVGKKTKNVGNLVACSMERILEEIKHCEVICANCHRLRTKKRRLNQLS